MCQSSKIPSFINLQDHAMMMYYNIMTNEVNISSLKMYLLILKEHILPESFVRMKLDSSSICQILDIYNYNVNKLKNQDVKVKLYERIQNF